MFLNIHVRINMKRRDISKVLLATAGAGTAVLSNNAEAQSVCTAPCYPIMPAEGSAVRNTAYPPGDVRRYGADPSGTNDSTTALRNAIATGYSLFFPAGTFLIIDVLKPKPRTTWSGPGTLKAAANIVTMNGVAKMVVLENLTDFEFAIDTDMLAPAAMHRIAVEANGSSDFIIRDGRHQGGTILIGGMAGCNNFSVRNNYFTDAKVADPTSNGVIYINARSSDFEILSNRITRSMGAGIAIFNGSFRGIVAKNSCVGCTGSGIYINSGKFLLIEANICNNNEQSGIGLNPADPDGFGFPAQCSVIGNTCCGNKYDGIDYNLAAANNGNRYSTNSIISGNILSDNGTPATGGTGIYLGKADQTTIIGNSMVGNNLEGLFLNDCVYCNVTGNMVVANGRNAPNSSDGISIAGSMNNITGNTSTNNGGGANQRYGIGEQGNANNNNIVGNNLWNNASGAVLIRGANTTVQGNQPVNFEKLYYTRIISSFQTPSVQGVPNGSLWSSPGNGRLYVLQNGAWVEK
jgi:parallel beta-helix repeat protein